MYFLSLRMPAVIAFFSRATSNDVVSHAMLALALALAQLAFALSFGMVHYTSLLQWDSGWYGNIVDIGYSLVPLGPNQVNLAFFPGYPIATRIVKLLSGLSTGLSLLLTAELMCGVFWFYWLKLLRGPLGLSVSTTGILTALLICEPGAFYLIAGYSESLFLFGVAGFIYWYLQWNLQPHRWGTLLLCVAHGVITTSTRLVGIVVVIFPFVYTFFNQSGHGSKNRLRVWMEQTFIAVGGSLGLIAFMAFCQVKFGNPWLFWDTNTKGWNGQSDWLFFLNPVLYWNWLPPAHSPDASGRALVLATIVAAVIGIVWASRRPWVRSQPAFSMLLTGCAVLVITLVGRASVNFVGFLRYLLPIHLLLLPMLGAWLDQACPSKQLWRSGSVKNPLVLLSLYFLVLQLCFLIRFGKGFWVG